MSRIRTLLRRCRCGKRLFQGQQDHATTAAAHLIACESQNPELYALAHLLHEALRPVELRPAGALPSPVTQFIKGGARGVSNTVWISKSVSNNGCATIDCLKHACGTRKCLRPVSPASNDVKIAWVAGRGLTRRVASQVPQCQSRSTFRLHATWKSTESEFR